jgi:hypothetical protein
LRCTRTTKWSLFDFDFVQDATQTIFTLSHILVAEEKVHPTVGGIMSLILATFTPVLELFVRFKNGE